MLTESFSAIMRLLEPSTSKRSTSRSRLVKLAARGKSGKRALSVVPAPGLLTISSVPRPARHVPASCVNRSGRKSRSALHLYEPLPHQTRCHYRSPAQSTYWAVSEYVRQRRWRVRVSVHYATPPAKHDRGEPPAREASV